MTTITEDQRDQLTRGAVEVYSTDELDGKLKLDRPLRVKYGMDPTAPDIHLGHTVQMRMLRRFQDLGHVVVLIIGDYTARIGDPSGRDTTRPVLTPDEVDANARTYLDQAGIILDTDPARLEVRRNSEWFDGLSFAETLKLTGQVTVQQMIARDNFKSRIDAGREIVIAEMMYPLMQAYDSVMIDADIEFGGTDQTFNCLMGRDLMAKMGKPRQLVIVTPLIPGLDGSEKMSKSKGNYVALTDPPNDMYGKIMSIPDELMGDYFRLLTSIPETRIRSLINFDTTHPRDSKDCLARTIVEDYHDMDTANAAAEEFRRRFAEGQLPTDIELKHVGADAQPLASLIANVGYASSNSEARRLIQQGAVTLDDQKIDDPKAQVTIPADRQLVLKVGKRRVCKVTA
ncbi:MAG: tyrosine--tRNA ligase [Planctomycetaceae bacterium]|nr:tyrosine--tRNA ligase [Planctomycetaceae bacterium]